MDENRTNKEELIDETEKTEETTEVTEETEETGETEETAEVTEETEETGETEETEEIEETEEPRPKFASKFYSMPAEKNSLLLHVVMILCFAAAAVFNFWLAYHTYALVPLIGGVIAIAAAAAECFTRRIPLFGGLAVLALLVFMVQIAGPMRPMGQEGYAQQHAYQLFLLRDTAAHFPAQLPDNVQDYSMRYDSMFEEELPVYSVSFRTDTDTAAMLAQKAEASALTVFNYSDYLAQNDVYRRKMELMTGSKDFSVIIYAPIEIDEPDGWKVYIQYTNIRQNYPKTGAVMVNVDSGQVCYFKHG